jgi:glycosyltransferase involved in cell wall biosynthesis
MRARRATDPSLPISAKPRVAFVTNFCPHYRVRTFEMLSAVLDVHFFFYSRGGEWYWLPEHGISRGAFAQTDLRGFSFCGTRIAPSLIPRLWSGHYDVFLSGVVGRFTMPATYLVARTLRRPFLLWTGIWTRIETPAHRWLFPITRHVYRHADAVVVYGNHVARYLVSEGVREQRIFVAPHAVDNPYYQQTFPATAIDGLRERLGVGRSKRLILFVGRLEEIKGLCYLLEAFALLRRADAVLVLCGSGSQRNRLEALARRLAISELVRFTGYVTPPDTLRYYAAAYALVLPSITVESGKEAWGLVVNEAFNQGCPVVTTDCVGAAAGGLVSNRVTGFVVREQSAPELAGAIKNLLDDPPLRETLSRNAVSFVARWNNEAMVRGFVEAIGSVVRLREY